MNRSFIIIMIPAVFVAAMYISLGIYPPARVYVGIFLFALALGIYRVRAMRMKRGNAGAQKTGPVSPALKP